MRYDAFISYRHSDLDMYVAKKIHKGLETFKVPKTVAKKSGKRHIKRVFRDQEELPIGSDLGDNIEGALAESEFLLVICSPRTPESYWVQKEITTFIQMHGREHVLAILIEGEPEQSFPKQLLVDENGNPVEPLAADVRGNTKAEIHKKLKVELMRLAAPILGCSYDDLRQRHRERKMKKMAAISVAVAVFAVAFGVYSAYNTAMIRQNLEGKQRNQSKYLADTAISLLEEGDRRAAVLVALEALPTEENKRPYVAEAQYALSEALHCYQTGTEIQMDRLLRHDLPVKSFYMNDEATRIVSIDQGGYVYLWDATTGEKLMQISPRVNAAGYMIEPVEVTLFDEGLLICDNAGVHSLDMEGNERWSVEAKTTYCLFDENAGIVACCSLEEVNFFDMKDGSHIAQMPNQMEDTYSSKMAFNKDASLCAVSHLTADEQAGQGWVSVYNFKTGQITELATKVTYIAGLTFTEDDGLVVAGSMYTDLRDLSQRNATGYIEKFDVQVQLPVWVNEFSYQVVGSSSASTRLKYRNFVDKDTNEVVDEVLMSVDNVAYTWNGVTGELLAETQVGSGIMQFLIAESSKFGYFAEDSGAIDIVDMSTGTIYANNTIETGKILRGAQIKNGVVALRAYASPDITLMKCQEGAGLEKIGELASSVQSICASKEETYYAVVLYGSGGENHICFYRTKDQSLVSEWKGDEEGYAVKGGFVEDDTYVVICRDGSVRYIDVTTGETEKIEPEDFGGTADCSTNQNFTKAFIYDGQQYSVVDLVERKVIATGDVGSYFRAAIITEDGNYAYGNTKENGFCMIDIAKGTVTSLEMEGYEVLNGGDEDGAFCSSTDGRLLAVSCQDGFLRVLDLNEMQTVAEIPFAARNRIFLKFSDDNQKLMMQGDDYYFRVYDLKTKEFSYVSTEQYYEIEEAIVDEDSQTLSLVTITDMVIVSIADYERLADIEDGKCYLPQYAEILCSYNNELYKFPYMSLDELLAEAERQFGNDSLTELERIQHHVE